ncbi:MAG: GMC oxidoreductase [Gammaproteobacteria bacterium]
MLVDTRELSPNTLIEAEVAIIGGGIAGITIARQLERSGISACVLESGGEEPDADVQDLYRGSAQLVGPGGATRNIDDYLTSSRFRYFGGSGNAWGGKCVPLDPADFSPRDWVADSGWPMTRENLQPYYDRACELLEISTFPVDPAMHWTADRPAMHLGDARLQSLPRRFTRLTGAIKGNRYGAFKDHAAKSLRTRVYLHANVRDIRLRESGDAVEALDVRTLDGRAHTARARYYVLAAGGIENARLLLASNDVVPAGIGNGNDLVGRFFQGHVTLGLYDGAAGRNSSICFSRLDQVPALYVDGDREKVQAVLGPTWKAQQQHRLRNCTLTPFETWYPAQSSSAAILGMARLIDGRLERLDADAVAGNHGQFFFMIEQMPNDASRVTLMDERDSLGMPRVRLDWTYDEQDFAELDRAVDFFRRELGRTAQGRVEWPVIRDELIQTMSMSRHHIGTTRMHASPRRGVVNPDCCLHEVRNLYVAGSSVFPTGGIANPTLTLTALALRLSDHLQSTLGS